MSARTREATNSKSTTHERSSGVDLAFALNTLDGRYHVLDRIAAGGMGEVYRAHDVVLERPVAIKVLHRSLAGDAGLVDRFRREARAAASLNHQNIVAVHDWGSVDGIYYMVMEYVAGLSVRELLNERGVLAPAQAVDVLDQTLAALQHAHRQGIVHRDIKPENLMVTRDGVVKVADFGLARALADAQITEAGTVTGTVQYLAPEQLQGEPADARTDLYSLGIVAFELLTGRLPFTGETPMGIAYKHIHERVPPPSSFNPAVPAPLDGWVASVTEQERELRPESAAEARRDLTAESGSLPAAEPLDSLVPDVSVIRGPEPDARVDRAATVTIPGRTTRHLGRRPWWKVGLVLMLALFALASAGWAAWAYLIPHRVDVPSVIGMPVDNAQTMLGDAGLVVRMAQGEYSTRIAADHVLRVQPPEGTTLDKGDRVTLVPSLGPRPVPVPNVIGKTLPKARSVLHGAGLQVGDVRREYDERADEGLVIRQSVEGDAQAPIGSDIDLVISRGPTPVPVPKVVGLEQSAATAALEAAGFVVNVDEEFSDKIERGVVISQTPARGTELQPGSDATIVVSKGPPEFAMPSVVGMSRDDAVAKLRSLELLVDVSIVPGHPGARVVFQEPAAGTTVRAGDLVHVYVA
ncbi:MAG TPA: Stk1 family PASTA domain-containing Ser/Thr kinase [Actinomycetota bacterium]|nr:Stk1 family PASTA domain-containing Ser/Thr kinase [Actinomycetota bacterium]